MNRQLHSTRNWLWIAGLLTLPAADLPGQTTYTQNFAFTGTVQSFTVPTCVNQITIEVWGAQGGGSDITGNTANTPSGGRGGYSKGTLNVTPGDVLNIYVGGAGGTATTGLAPGGYNGGGSGNSTSLIEPGNGGGGATDVRHNGVALSNRVIVAGGGGGGGEDGADNPGHGGGASGAGGTTAGYNASQTAAGTNGSLGQGSNTNQADGGGGGGGYYGGGSGTSATSGADAGGGGGGSGYIGGVINGTTIAGNVAIPTPTGGTSIGRGGDGYARLITNFTGTQVTISPSTLAICSGDNGVLTGSDVSTYTWLPSNNFLGSNSANIIVTPSVTTTYSLVGADNLGCISQTVVNLVVNPVPTISAVFSPSVPCVDGTTTLTASGANSYTWSGISGNTSVVTITLNSSTNLNYSGSNMFGCITNSAIAINVNTNVVSISPNIVICSGGSATLKAGNIQNWSWSTGEDDKSITVTPAATTVYSVSGTDIHNCFLSNTVQVTVNQKPTVTAGVTRTLLCLGETADLQAQGAASYTWSYGICGFSGTGNSVTINPDDVVYCYTVTGTGTNGCTNTGTVSTIVAKCTGVSELSGMGISKVYPNPANGKVTVELSSDMPHTIEVLDLTGRTLLSTETKNQKTELDLQDLSQGVYYFTIRSTNGSRIVKVVKN